MARVQTSVEAEVGATLTILQSGDPHVIFKHHACCTDYGTTTCHTPCWRTALILAATCIPLCSPPHSAGVLLSISIYRSLYGEILGGSYVEESPAPITEAKAPLVVQWSNPLLPVQRIPSGEGSNLAQGRSWSDPNNPPNWYFYKSYTKKIEPEEIFSQRSLCIVICTLSILNLTPFASILSYMEMLY